MLSLFKRKSDLEEKDIILRGMMVRNSSRRKGKREMNYQNLFRLAIIFLGLCILGIGIYGVLM